MSAGTEIAQLKWLNDPLEELFNQLQTQLRALETDRSQALWQECAGNLQQLQLTLGMVQVHGAALLAEEIRALGDHLFAAGGEPEEDRIQMLQEAELTLRDYLDYVSVYGLDQALVLTGQINRLRQARQAELLHEGKLFYPPLDKPLPDLDTAKVKSSDNLYKLRKRWQQALRNWLRDYDDQQMRAGDSTGQALQQAALALSLSTALPEAPARACRLTAEVIRAVQSGSANNDVHLGRLLARVDTMLAMIKDSADSNKIQRDAEDVTRAMLYYLASCEPADARLQQIRDHYGLDALIDRRLLKAARASLRGTNRALREAVGEAITDELVTLKDQVEQLQAMLSSGSAACDSIAQGLHGGLLRMAGSLRLLDYGATADRLQQHAAELLHPRDDRMQPLAALADTLLDIENTVSAADLSDPSGDVAEQIYQTGTRQVLDLAVRQLDQVQLQLDGILRESAAGKTPGKDVLRQPRRMLVHISGALRMINEPRLAHVLRRGIACLETIDWQSGGLQGHASLHDFAGLLAALERYLISIRDNAPDAPMNALVMDYADRMPEAEIIEPEPERAAATAAPAADSRASSPLPDQGEAAPVSILDEPLPAPGESTWEPDAELRQTFIDELQNSLATLDENVERFLSAPARDDTLLKIRRCFHTIKGSARMINAGIIGTFAFAVESLLNAVRDHQLEPRQAVAVLPDAQIHLHEQLQWLQRGQQVCNDATLTVINRCRQALAPEQASGTPGDSAGEDHAAAETAEKDDDTQLNTIIVEELEKHQATIDAYTAAIRNQGEIAPDKNLLLAVHTMAGTLALQPTGGDQDIMHACEAWLQDLHDQERTPDAEGLELLKEISTLVGIRILGVEDTDAYRQRWEQLSSRLQVLRHENGARQAEQTATEEAPEDSAPETAGNLDEEFPEPDHVPDTAAATALDELPDDPFADSPASEYPRAPAPDEMEAAAEETEPVAEADSAIDPQILETFLDEAGGELENLDAAWQQWLENGDTRAIDVLNRSLHTMKGAANMAGFRPIGELTHALESFLNSQPAEDFQQSDLRAMRYGIDQLHEMLGAVTTGAPLPEADLSAFGALPPEAEDQEDRFLPAAADSTAAAHPDSGTAASDTARPGASLRVDAGKIDQLSNIAGEVGIFRAHMEQEAENLRGGITEMGQTIERLREQLRKLELETEAQILSRHQHEATLDRGFDPLELDRYSTIQQLSRALAESANDLVSLQATIDNSSEHFEYLLAQQARANAELQDGLLQTRMVPFANIAPRLRQVVRRTATELGVDADLHLKIETGGELDRSVLERITAPLEHMLRNSLVHGIEDPDTRRQQGKPATGQITISVQREAAELVIRIEDDGRGLDFDTVLETARRQGLVDPEARLDDRDIAQLIFTPGFTTSGDVTELAGRGFGMDVVRDTVRQIGGTLQWHSEADQGMRFEIRIPQSLAIMQSLVITCGGQLFAVPVVNLLGVTKIPVDDYRQYVAEGSMPYANQDNPVFDLEALLDMPPSPVPDSLVTMLVVESAGQNAALRINELRGHQELVVKPLGPQLTSIPGILAGSVSREGEVIVILDPGALVAARLNRGDLQTALDQAGVEPGRERPLVLIVDDSITMRKITTRVLEQHAIDVRTARDGIEAIEVMDEERPDLLLLDIEMPRMDGFELAAYMRGHNNLRDIPIIIISSRSGEKHVQRAREIGANDFIGKPYGEKDLMLKVNQLLAHHYDQAAAGQA